MNTKLYARKVLYTTRLLFDYLHDFYEYNKWNYNNPRVNTLSSYEAKIFRQTHTVEKGMSVESPKVGFGTQKIDELICYLNQYIKLGFDTKRTAFRNAVGVMFSYMEFQKNSGYENVTLFSKISLFDRYLDNNTRYGTETITKHDLQNKIHSNFDVFFSSRHSLRQFDERDIEINDIKDAILIARKAPTACNRQASKVYYFEEKELNLKIGEIIAGNTGFENDVNKYLIVTADISSFYDPFERNQLYVEAGIFACGLVQSLHYKGIASCILQNGERQSTNKKLKKICGIPENEKIVLFIAVGYYKDEITYAISNRKNIYELFEVK